MKKFLFGVLWLGRLFYPVEAQDITDTNILGSSHSYQYALIEASRQKMIGNIDEAINLYELCIKANPGCDVAYYELGTVYSALGKNDKAESNLQNAFERKPDNYWYGIAYSELLKVNRKFKESLKVLRQIRKVSAQGTVTIDYKIAELHVLRKNFKKALEILDYIENTHGISEMVTLKKLEIFKLQKKYDEAESLLKKLMESSPDIAEFAVMLAEFYAETGENEKALIMYIKAFEIDSTNIFAITNLADIYAEKGMKDKGYFFLKQAFISEVIPLKGKIQTMMHLNANRDLIRQDKIYIEELVEVLLSLYPESLDAKTVAYDFYNGIEDNEKALEIIKEILRKRKDDFIIWQQALYNASMLENYNEIVKLGKEASKYFPNKVEIFLFLGMSYFQLSSYDSAYQILKQAYFLKSDNEQIRLQVLAYVSQAAYNAGYKDDSYQFFEELIRLDPENDFVKNNYSYYLALDSISLGRAKELSFSTITKSPENSTFLDTYAWILYKMGSFSEAKFYMEKALAIHGETDPDMVFHYAEILYRIGDLKRALNYYHKALELGYDKEMIFDKIQKYVETP